LSIRSPSDHLHDAICRHFAYLPLQLQPQDQEHQVHSSPAQVQEELPGVSQKSYINSILHLKTI